MSKIKSFLKTVIDEVKLSPTYGEYFSSKIEGNTVVITTYGGSRYKVSFEELEPTIAHDYSNDKEMSREDFIEKYGDD